MSLTALPVGGGLLGFAPVLQLLLGVLVGAGAAAVDGNLNGVPAGVVIDGRMPSLFAPRARIARWVTTLGRQGDAFVASRGFSAAAGLELFS